MAALVTIGILLALALIGVVMLYRHEVIRMAKDIQEHPEASNTRLTVAVPLPGCPELAKAVNGLLDEVAQREFRQKLDEEDLLAGLAGLSHDIRTPLAGAKGYLQLAQQASDEVEARRCLGLAEERFGAMQGMLDQLFDYTHAIHPQSELRLEEVDVNAILTSVLAGNYPSFRELDWEPEVKLGEEPLMAFADLQALQRIFENIVANMLKHGAGDIRIVREGYTMSFANGMPEDSSVDEMRLFERFYRGDAARSSAGAGLGLPVAKRLCDSMGIEIYASVSGETFTLSLVF